MCPSRCSDVIYTDLHRLGVNFSTQNEDHNNYMCDNVNSNELFFIYKSDGLFFATSCRPLSVTRLFMGFTEHREH